MRVRWLGVVSLALVGCGLDAGGDGADIDLPDGATADANAPDTGPPKDGSVQDASVQDATMQDATVQDATVQDATSGDASAVDAAPDASPLDAAPDAGPLDAAPDANPCGPNANACANLPNIWTPIAFDPAMQKACASGFAQLGNYVTAPTSNGAVCTCQAQGNTFSCTTGKLSTGNGGNCGSGGPSFSVSGGQCLVTQGSVSQTMKLSPIGLTGSCTAAATPDLTKVSVTTTTACTAQKCPGDICAGVVPQGFNACIVAQGLQSCPAPFNASKYTVGDQKTATCGACTCSGTASCSNDKLEFFSQNGCNGNDLLATVTSSCQGTGANNATFQSVRYTATMGPVNYTLGASSAALDVTNARTVCCR
jgi:hypothetical protein